MKSAIKLLLILSIATICCGFVYAHLQANKITTKREVFVERVHSGDTVDEILLQYFNSENEGGITFDEFKFDTLHLPENKHLLNQSGGLKLLQVGDRIVIVTKVRVKNDNK